MNLYKYDVHVHTEEVSPCGMVAAEKAVRMYKEAGYDGLVITDHFRSRFFEELNGFSWEEKIDKYLRGYYKAKEMGIKLDVRVLLGLEVTFSEYYNDYLIFGIDENFLKRHRNLHKMDLDEFYNFKEKVKQDILIYQAHPFRNKMTIVDPELLDGVEVYNGNPRHDSRNDMAQQYARRHHLKKISGSDFHELEDIDRGGILLPDYPDDEKELVQFLIDDYIEELLIADEECSIC